MCRISVLEEVQRIVLMGKAMHQKRLRRLLGDCTSTDWKERFVYVCNQLTDGFNSLAAWQIQDTNQGEKEASDGKNV